jgi:flagellar biosynthesis chaperone FliJ
MAHEEKTILKVVKDCEGMLACFVGGTAWRPSEKLITCLEEELKNHSKNNNDLAIAVENALTEFQEAKETLEFING